MPRISSRRQARDAIGVPCSARGLCSLHAHRGMASPSQEFFARTYGLGHRTGTVFAVCAFALALLVFLVTPSHTLMYRAVIIGVLVYVFTRRSKWPALIVAPDAIEVNTSIFKKHYRRLAPADIVRMEMTDDTAVIAPKQGNSITIKRRGFRVPVCTSLWDALHIFSKSIHPQDV